MIIVFNSLTRLRCQGIIIIYNLSITACIYLQSVHVTLYILDECSGPYKNSKNLNNNNAEPPLITKTCSSRNELKMCKHILNVQAAIRSPCCKKWFDCAECHDELEDHKLKKSNELVMACKVCKKVFRKDVIMFEEADEYCPHCDNKYVLDAVTKEDR